VSFRGQFLRLRGGKRPKGTSRTALVTAAPKATQKDVVLWVDTFNNAFHPQTLQSAFDLFLLAGCRVITPIQGLCCGRPLYDFGMLREAREYLQRILAALGPQIDAGMPVVVLEPSCASVFRDELCNLLPGEPRAALLKKQTLLLSEYLERHTTGLEQLRLPRKVLLQGHCHHQSIMKMRDEESVLRKMGAELQVLDAGCCGMAGPFGFEKEKYAVSRAIGERVLLPAVRQAAEDTLIVADGFSCREMIHQETSRRAMHLSQVLQMALHEGPDGARDSLPEARYAVVERTPALPASVVLGGAAALIGLWFATRNA